MNKTTKILIVLLVIFILGGAGGGYYLYSKYDSTKNELEKLKKENETKNDTKEESELTGNILLDGDIITVDSSDEETVLFSMNGEQHSLSFKYTYHKNPNETLEQAYYYSYRVETEIYFDNINITELTDSKKAKSVYFHPANQTLEDIKEHVGSFSLMDRFDLQIIKGFDNKDYLFISILEKGEDNSSATIPIIVNSEGKVIYEVLDKITFFTGYTLKDTVDAALYGDKGYHLDKNENNQHIINVLAYKNIENGNEKTGYHEAFKNIITINNNLVDVNQTSLDPVLYTPYMEW